MKTNIHEPIQNRFSPMIYNGEMLNSEMIHTLLESASLAASSYNAQSWRFIYAVKGSQDYSLLRSLLSEYNQVWTTDAPVLMLSVAKRTDDKGKENYYAMHDLGQAASSMAIQASAMGLQIHQMGGYDMAKARNLLKIPEDYMPGAMIAIGIPGDISQLKGHFRERAEEPRSRLSITEISGGVDFFTI